MSENTKPTRANVPPPAKRGFLPETPVVVAADNMRDKKLAPMTFNMPDDWHKRFKGTAMMNNMSMKELLIESFAAWEREQLAKSRR